MLDLNQSRGVVLAETEGCTEMSDLHLALGLCISWDIEIHFVNTIWLVITMVKYDFCCGSIKYWSKKPESKPLAMQTFPVTLT